MTLADRITARPAVIMKDSNIYAFSIEQISQRPWSVSCTPYGVLHRTAWEGLTPAPATPASLGVDSGASVQFAPSKIAMFFFF